MKECYTVYAQYPDARLPEMTHNEVEQPDCYKIVKPSLRHALPWQVGASVPCRELHAHFKAPYGRSNGEPAPSSGINIIRELVQDGIIKFTHFR